MDFDPRDSDSRDEERFNPRDTTSRDFNLDDDSRRPDDYSRDRDDDDARTFGRGPADSRASNGNGSNPREDARWPERDREALDRALDPREVFNEREHDLQVYRAYERAAERLGERGAHIDGVVLDHELKREYQTWLYERHRRVRVHRAPGAVPHPGDAACGTAHQAATTSSSAWPLYAVPRSFTSWVPRRCAQCRDRAGADKGLHFGRHDRPSERQHGVAIGAPLLTFSGSACACPRLPSRAALTRAARSLRRKYWSAGSQEMSHQHFRSRSPIP
jgi:hypothetical protein